VVSVASSGKLTIDGCDRCAADTVQPDALLLEINSPVAVSSVRTWIDEHFITVRRGIDCRLNVSKVSAGEVRTIVVYGPDSSVYALCNDQCDGCANRKVAQWRHFSTPLFWLLHQYPSVAFI
jgi:hypothetical protein